MINQERLVGQTKLISMHIFNVVQEEFYGKKLILADRDMVETESDAILQNADKEDVALLVVGDPFGFVSDKSDFYTEFHDV